MLTKGKKLFLATATMLALYGCASPPEPPPPEMPIKVNAVYKERCYAKDTVEQEVAGRAYLEEGQQFYFQPECDNYLVKDAVQSAEKANGKGDSKAVAKAIAAPKGFKVNPVKSANTKTEPTCYFDKEGAGRGDLPPCPWDEEKQEYIKD